MEDDDLERLAQILAYRELGFSLDDVGRVLADPATDDRTHLRRQHRLLRQRIDRLSRMAAAVQHALEAKQMDLSLTPEERLEVFGDFRPEDHEEEVRERWGDTDAHAQSQQRAALYQKGDWLRISAEATEIYAAAASAMAAGEPATGAAAMAAAERHRQHINHWCYECRFAMHRGLGQMYVDDPRSTATIEASEPGLAPYLRDAIFANADRIDADPAG